jgi:protein SCO1/2
MTKQKVNPKKVAILISILLLPSFFYLILYSGEHNYQHLEYIGPKEVVTVTENGESRLDTLYHRIPAFSFIDQEGRTVTKANFEGKIYVADFFFATCPTICPKMATHLLQLQKKFEDKTDFKLLSHTVNPEHDTVKVLKDYAEKVHADSNVWHFVTGPKADIYRIAFEGYFANAQPDSIAPGGFLHSEMLFLIDRQGHIRGLFDGTSTAELKKMIDAIDALYLEDYVHLKEKK